MVKYNEDLWIGMNDINWEMHFVWTDGKGIQYTNWAKGQPSSGPSGRYSDTEVPVLAAYKYNNLTSNVHWQKLLKRVTM